MDLAAIEAERARLHDQYIEAERPSSSARGIHHTALLSSDVERTIRFYQGILEFPLTEIIENRDYEGSNHFFFDVGNGNAIAFFNLGMRFAHPPPAPPFQGGESVSGAHFVLRIFRFQRLRTLFRQPPTGLATGGELDYQYPAIVFGPQFQGRGHGYASTHHRASQRI